MANTTSIQKKNQKKQAIYEAAVKLMKERSFEEVTIKDICETAGISNGKFFYYFKSKDELLSFYITDGYPAYLAEHEPDSSATNDFIKQIVDLYIVYIEYCEQAGLAFLKSYYSTANPALDTHGFGNEYSNLTMMRDLGFLICAQQKGYLVSATDPIQTTIDCCTIIKGIIFEWCVCDGSFDPKDAARRLLRNYLLATVTEKYRHEFDQGAL